MIKIISSKKTILIIFAVILLLTGIIALTQELDTDYEEPETEDGEEISFEMEIEPEPEPEPIPVKWFISNAGGLALEETQSRFVALRSEYALAIDSAHFDEIPGRLIQYYKDDYFIELRLLYKNTKLLRTQWIFRDENKTTRVNAVFIEQQEEVKNEAPAVRNQQVSVSSTQTEKDTEQTEESEQLEINNVELDEGYEHIIDVVESEDKDEEEVTIIVQEIKTETKTVNEPVSKITGFIEIYDEKTFLTSELRYYDNDDIIKIDYESNRDMIVSAAVSLFKNNEYVISYKDYYRYNRNSSLRAVERVFYRDTKIDPLRVAFPRRIMEAVNETFFSGQRLNMFPEYFGDIFAYSASKIIFESDDRGRIISQTLFNDDGEVVWIVRSRWHNDRIISTTKTEGDTVLLAEFTYSSSGDRIIERNSRNGVLERVVRTEGRRDIEELYFDNVHILTAVWQDGRKISETRVR